MLIRGQCPADWVCQGPGGGRARRTAVAHSLYQWGTCMPLSIESRCMPSTNSNSLIPDMFGFCSTLKEINFLWYTGSVVDFLIRVCVEFTLLLPTMKESYISDLDAKSGASLKLTVLNQRGRIWTMVAGGGASVIYR